MFKDPKELNTRISVGSWEWETGQRGPGSCTAVMTSHLNLWKDVEYIQIPEDEYFIF